jgi:MoxR-like ATPase
MFRAGSAGREAAGRRGEHAAGELARPDQAAAGAPAAELPPEAAQRAEQLRRLVAQVERVVVGQRAMVEGLVIGLITGGHVLLEGVPGLAKTLTVSTLARALDASFSRVQFTPDLLPADLVGTMIYHPTTGEFSARKGPIFAHIVLADEINRAPAKVQSALLEAMQERQVTIGDTTFPLDDPFLVLATQNPIEQEGTYPLPEAQVDRFMLKIRVGYPDRQQERLILDRMATSRPDLRVEPVMGVEDVRAARSAVDTVRVDDRIKDYVVALVHATREPASVPGLGAEAARLIEFGASPRAGISLVLAARAHAFVQGRAYVLPSDVKAVAMNVLRHRVLPSYEAQAEDLTAEDLVGRILEHVPVP